MNEDRYGDIINVNQLYKCSCGFIGTVKEMYGDYDCGDEYDAIWSDYCCPNCYAFYLRIINWEKQND